MSAIGQYLYDYDELNKGTIVTLCLRGPWGEVLQSSSSCSRLPQGQGHEHPRHLSVSFGGGSGSITGPASRPSSKGYGVAAASRCTTDGGSDSPSAALLQLMTLALCLRACLLWLSLSQMLSAASPASTSLLQGKAWAFPTYPCSCFCPGPLNPHPTCRGHLQPHKWLHSRGHPGHHPAHQQHPGSSGAPRLPLREAHHLSEGARSASGCPILCLPGTCRQPRRPGQPQHLPRWGRQLAAGRPFHLHKVPARDNTSPAAPCPYPSSSSIWWPLSPEPDRPGQLHRRRRQHHRPLPAQPVGPLRRLHAPP